MSEVIEWKPDQMLEVTIKEPDDFLKIRETLTRIGVASRKERKIYQSCHILHKQGRYFIVHFKELFALDGLPTDISETDLGRRNAIANLLDEWELLEVVDIEKTENPRVSLAQIKILSYNEKKDWELIPKYHIGRRR